MFLVFYLINETLTNVIADLEDKTKLIGDFENRWYVGQCITGWGYVTIIPWNTQNRAIGIEQIRAFTASGWTEPLGITDIKTYEGCFVIICSTTEDMVAGTSYISQITGNVR